MIKPSIVNCDYKEKYREIFWENRLLQTPWVAIKLLVGLLFNLIVFIFLLKDPTDDDIINYVENSPLALLIWSGAEFQDGVQEESPRKSYNRVISFQLL